MLSEETILVTSILVTGFLIFTIPVFGTHMFVWLHDWVKYNKTELTWAKELIIDIIRLVAMFYIVSFTINIIQGKLG